MQFGEFENDSSNRSFSSIESDQEVQHLKYENIIPEQTHELPGSIRIVVDQQTEMLTIRLPFWSYLKILIREDFRLPFQLERMVLLKAADQVQELYQVELTIPYKCLDTFREYWRLHQAQGPSNERDQLSQEQPLQTVESNSETRWIVTPFSENFVLIRSQHYCIFKLGRKLYRHNIEHLIIGDSAIINKNQLAKVQEFNVEVVEINQSLYFQIDFSLQHPPLHRVIEVLQTSAKHWALKYQLRAQIKILFVIQTYQWHTVLLAYQICSRLALNVGTSNDETDNMLPLLSEGCFLQSTLKQELSTLTRTAQKDSFVDLIWYLSIGTILEDNNFEKKLNLILDNWELYRLTYQKSIGKLISIIQNHLLGNNDYEIIYPSLRRLLSKMKKITQLKSSQAELIQGEFVVNNDAIVSFNHFIQELRAKSYQNSPYYVQDQKTHKKVLLADLIEQNRSYSEKALINDRWQSIFAKSAIQIRAEYQLANALNERIILERRNRLGFMDNIERERLINYSCIGCCPFFFANTNIWHPFVCKSPILTAGKIMRVSEQALELKDRVCFLLNNGGGVVLFDCQRKYPNIIPTGEYFDKKSQESYEHKVYKILEGIYPKVRIDQNIQMSFVPILQDPTLSIANNFDLTSSNDKCYDQIYYQRPYIKGLYVARIKVKPTIGQRTYFWMAANNRPIVPVKSGEDRFTATPGNALRLIIRQKFEKFHVPDDLSPQERQEFMFNLPRLSCFHDGQCTPPDAGRPLTNSSLLNQLPGAHPYQEQQKVDFAFMSLLLARKQDHALIRERLRRKGIECEIKNLYSSYNFKAAMNAAVLYHDMRFDKLLDAMAYNKEFSFNGKFAKVIYVTQFLKLPNQSTKNLLSKEDLRVLEEWVKKEHENETLKFWSYQNDESTNEYYIQTGSRESTVLLYFVLNEFQEKCEFRNPKNFDKLAMAERGQKMKLIFAEGERSHYESESRRPVKTKIMSIVKPHYFQQKLGQVIQSDGSEQGFLLSLQGS